MMFRVRGRNAHGSWVELSIQAGTEVEARDIALKSGVVAIDQVSVPPPLREPSRVPKLNGSVVGFLACVGCLGITFLGAAIGVIVGNETEPANNFIRLNWLFGGVIGATIGLILGVSILVAFLKSYWNRR